ncbi:MAG: glycosyltransferase [Burkholderiaceae bacterium]
MSRKALRIGVDARTFLHPTALLHLSLYEGFGLPLLEAMSRGVPVVASNLRSMPEVLGGAGCRVDPCDERAWPAMVAEWLSTPARMSERRARGQDRAAHFSWERSAQQAMAILGAAAGRTTAA